MSRSDTEPCEEQRGLLMAGLGGEGLWVAPPGFWAHPAAVTKPEFPWLAGVGLARHPGMPSWVLGHQVPAVPIVTQGW